MTELTLAMPGEEKECYAILDSGRNFQREQGFIQWDEEYPTFAMVEEDIRIGRGYVVRIDGKIAVYTCVMFGVDQIYNEIDGEWETDEPYCVFHRLAISPEFRGIGLSAKIFGMIEELAKSRGINAMRADTDFPNKRMQHCLEKAGYKMRGIIEFHGKKIAYDKSI